MKKKIAVRNNVVHRKRTGTSYLKTFCGLESAINSLQTLQEVFFFFFKFSFPLWKNDIVGLKALKGPSQL